MGLTVRRVGIVVGLALLAALVVLLLVRPPVAAPTADAEPSAKGVRRAIPARDPMPWRAATWQAVEAPLGPEAAHFLHVGGLVDTGDLILGWGRVAAPGRNQFGDMAATFVSADARTWRTAVITHGVNDGQTASLIGVAVGPRGFLAFGTVCCEPEAPAMWHSADGAKWERVALVGAFGQASWFTNVVGYEGGWIAAVHDGQVGDLWHSEDGSAWKEVDLGDAALGLRQVSDIAVAPDGLVAVGTVDGPDGTHDGGVWTSTDGLQWQRRGADDPALAGRGETELWRVVPLADGLFVGGTYGSTEDRKRCENARGLLASTDPQPPRTAISCGWGTEHHLVSADGETWERIDPTLGQGERPIEFRLVVPGGPGLVTFGESSAPAEADPTLFVSADGLSWNAVEPAGPIGSGMAIGLAVRSHSVLVVSEHFDGQVSEIRFWLGAAR